MHVRALVITACCASASACESKPAGPTSPGTVVTLELTGAQTIAPGVTTQLTLIAVHSDGSRTDVTATAEWNSSNSNVVRSMGQGRFLGGAIGEANITGRANRAVSREVVVVPDGTYRIVGRVTESGDPRRAVANALVRAVDSHGAGPSSSTDTGGYFRLYGVAADAELIVTRDGYSQTSQRLRVDTHTVINLEMPLAAPRLDVTGRFAATFDWSACQTSFPEDLRRRVYTADVTQEAARVQVRFTSPGFAMVNGVLSNLMEGGADPINVVIATPTTVPQTFYGITEYPVVEILPDDTRLEVFATVKLVATAAGFAGPIEGRAGHHGPRYPLDTERGSCTAGRLTLERR